MNVMRNMDWIHEFNFAHRGLHSNKVNVPENSMLAFKKAFEKGYGIEMDLHFLKDQSLVVFHDDSLKRMTKVDRLIDSFDYDELKEIKLLKSEEHIPLYTELLNSLPKGRPMLIEFKQSKQYKAMIDSFINVMKSSDAVFAIQSFDPRVLHYFKKKAPNILRGQIAEAYQSKKTFLNFLMNLFIANSFTRPDFINYHLEDLPNKRIDRLKNKGMTIISYTVKSQESFDFMKTNYDNCVFEGFEPKK